MIVKINGQELITAAATPYVSGIEMWEMYTFMGVVSLGSLVIAYLDNHTNVDVDPLVKWFGRALPIAGCTMIGWFFYKVFQMFYPFIFGGSLW